MAMDKDRLGTAIWTAIKALHTYNPAITAPMDAAGLLLWKEIAEEIILEIQGHAVVSSTGTDPVGDGLQVVSTGTVL